MKSSTICACLVSLSFAFAQKDPDRPSFEVASIKPADPNPSNPIWIGMVANRAMLNFNNITLKDGIRAAYRVRDFQITGPDWISTARFEIKAKLPDGASLEQIPEMMQNLLVERFKLAIRRDMKEESVYVLTVGSGGPKLKPAAATQPIKQTEMALGVNGKPRAAMIYGVNTAGVVLTASAASLASFAELMSRFTERPVVDWTGIEGLYDLHLAFNPETMRGAFFTSEPPAFTDPGPSIFDAVKEYGLRLEARKAPIEIITVTHLERTPTPD
jgi:uncharacterized protein (TIGR03435 family)